MNTPTTSTRPIVTTVAELEAAIHSVLDDEAAIDEALDAGELAHDLAGGSDKAGLAAMGEVFNRIVDQRFDVRVSPEIMRQRSEEMQEAWRAGISGRRQ